MRQREKDRKEKKRKFEGLRKREILYRMRRGGEMIGREG